MATHHVLDGAQLPGRECSVIEIEMFRQKRDPRRPSRCCHFAVHCYLPLLNFGGVPADVSRGSSSFPPLRGPRPEDVV